MAQTNPLVKNNVTKQAILVSIMISALLPSFMSSSITVALPSIGKEFGMNAVALSWISTAYLLSAAAFLVPFGRAADIYGRRRIFLWGVALLTLTSILCMLSQSDWQLITLRVLQGIGGCMLSSTGIAIVSSAYPDGERGKALGMIGITSYAGMSAGPALGGILTEYFGWRSIFLVSTLLGVIIIFTVLKYMKADWKEAKCEGFDKGGTLTYCMSLIALLCGFTFLRSAYGLHLLAAGIAGIIAFGIWASRVKNPLVDISLYRRNKVFLFSTSAALINYGITFVVSYLLSLYLQYVTGLSPQFAGIVLITQPVMQAIFSPFAGRLSDRMAPRLVSAMGMLLNGAGLCLLMFLGRNTPLLFIIAGLILEGLGCAFFISPNQNAVLQSVEKHSYGVASGILATMRFIGQMISMGIATLCATAYMGNVKITPRVLPAFLNSLHTTFIIMAALCLLGIGACLKKSKAREPSL
ncbi:MAG TPA: MFS transporter [Clostridia bacterium]|nr:MFS transporter [Clostridia bacterium]